MSFDDGCGYLCDVTEQGVGLSRVDVTFHVDETTPFTLFVGSLLDVRLTGGSLDEWFLQSSDAELSGAFEQGNSYRLQVEFDWDNDLSRSFALSAVPEPGTALLCGTGLALLGASARRRRVGR